MKTEIIYHKVSRPEEREVPYGIRNENGYLLFFPKMTYYPDQEERYAKEYMELVGLANLIKDAINQKRADEADQEVRL